MAGTVMLTIEGVLAQPKDSIVAAQPIPDGLLLFHALKGFYKIALAASSSDSEKLSFWLQMNGIRGQVQTLKREVEDAYLSEEELRFAQLRRLRSSGHSVSYVIDPSPLVIADSLAQGVQGLLFVSPSYMRADFRPDTPHKPRSWDAIEEEVTRQRSLRSHDPRPTADLED